MSDFVTINMVNLLNAARDENKGYFVIPRDLHIRKQDYIPNAVIEEIGTFSVRFVDKNWKSKNESPAEVSV